ncbi:MAG: hypothetical protein JW839_16660, partial [Candidatus Lokiarchaeota archaeon]|nr:hypothetical protein [Candidatus Lokiarchaeota archaeon]
MPVAFNIDRIHALGRSGVLRVTGAVDARVKTPVFVPSLHLPLLDVPAYAGFVESLVAAGKVKVALLPPQANPSALPDAVEKHAFIGKVVLLAEASGARPPPVPPCINSFPIHRSPYPSTALDATSAGGHARRFLDAMNQHLGESAEPVALAIDDHGFAEVIEGIDTSIINARS